MSVQYYVNDLYEMFSTVDSVPVKACDHVIGCLMFADDILIVSESVSGLQCSLDKFNKYCQKWKLHVNTVKTKTMY